MCIKAVDNHASALEFVPDRCKAQEICINVVDANHANLLELLPDRYETQEMCDKAVSENLFLLHIAMIDIKLKKCVMKMLMIV